MTKSHAIAPRLSALVALVAVLACDSSSSGSPPPSAAAEAPPAKANAEAPVAAEGTRATPDSDSAPQGLVDRDPQLAYELVEKGALLLDVRTDDEFAAGHVEGAVQIPFDELEDRWEEFQGHHGADPNRPVVVYCRSGRRSGIAKETLLKRGIPQVSNLGGMSDWCEKCGADAPKP